MEDDLATADGEFRRHTGSDRGAVRENRAQLLDLASCMFDDDRSVRPRGVLMLEHLLHDAKGPLYGHDAARQLSLALTRIREALDA